MCKLCQYAQVTNMKLNEYLTDENIHRQKFPDLWYIHVTQFKYYQKNNYSIIIISTSIPTQT